MSQQSPIQSKRLIFCFPGKSFSSAFLTAWSNILLKLTSRGHQVMMANRDESPWFVRNLCLGGNVLRGKHQKPYDGNLEYDYLFYVNHDIVFTEENVMQMLEHMKDETKQVVGAMVPLSTMEYDLIDKGHWDFKEFIQNGSFRSFTRRDLILKKNELFEVDHVSSGFVCIRKGVLEQLEYPWFKPLYFEFTVDVEDASGNITKREIRDYCSDDIAFSRSLAEKQIQMWVDPMLTVGREHMQLSYFDHASFVKQQQEEGKYDSFLEQLQQQP